MNRRTNAVRVGSSDPNRLAELKANHEELQKMLANGWQVTDIRVKPKRPRIHKEPVPKRIKVQAGPFTVIVEYTDWVANGSVGRIIEKY